MMVMVGVISHTGVFEWFAVEAYKKSGGSIWSLVVILCSVTAVLSAFLDNVTTILLLTPVTTQLAKVLDLKPIPLLISEVLFSNIGGAATMIGDPPNIMIGSGLSSSAIENAKTIDGGSYPQEMIDGGVSFNDFIIEIATIITDPQLNILEEGPVVAIHQPDSILDQMDEWNTRQHNQSG